MPTPDDYDLVQDAKADRERRIAATVAEIEDVPGTRILSIPTEHLCDSPQGRYVTRSARRLNMAFDLFKALVTGCWKEAIGPGNSTDRIRQFSWDQADRFLADSDRPPTPPAVAPAGDTLPADLRPYLAWVASFGPEGVPPSAHCPHLGPERSSAARRVLCKAGLVEACRWEDAHGYRASDKGRASLGDGAVRLAGQDEAA